MYTNHKLSASLGTAFGIQWNELRLQQQLSESLNAIKKQSHVQIIEEQHQSVTVSTRGRRNATQSTTAGAHTATVFNRIVCS